MGQVVVHIPSGRQRPPGASAPLAQRGWRQVDKAFYGFYCTPHGRWPGCFQWAGDNWVFFIHNPPRRLLQGPHGNCFAHIGDGWWRIHFQEKPHTPLEGVLGVEKALEEAYKGGGSFWRSLLGL